VSEDLTARVAELAAAIEAVPEERICNKPGCGRGGKLTRGMCIKDYRYWLDHTPPEERPPAPRFSRTFWDFVNREGPVPAHRPGLGPCWVWTGIQDPQGYGRLGGHRLAHRQSWEMANGTIEGGLWVLHHCDNPPCVNPAHLYLGTVKENVRDAVERGRMRGPSPREVCSKGHSMEGDNLKLVMDHGYLSRRCRKCAREASVKYGRKQRKAQGLVSQLLTDEERAEIIRLRQAGHSQRDIARRVGRAVVTVRRAFAGV